MAKKDVQMGVVNCLRLHVHEEPNLDSEIVCKIRYLSEVEVDFDNSTENYYKIYTKMWAEGYCEKELITLRK